MEQHQVTSKKKLGEEVKEATVNYNFGTLAENVEAFGEEVVNSSFVAKAKTVLQAIIGRSLEAGKTVEEIQAIADGWKPGVSLPRQKVDPITAMLNKFSEMDPDEQREFIGKLKARANQKK